MTKDELIAEWRGKMDLIEKQYAGCTFYYYATAVFEAFAETAEKMLVDAHEKLERKE